MSKKQVSAVLLGLLLAIVLVSLLVLLFPSLAAGADTIVNFPDPNLQAAIRQAINKPSGDIYQSDLTNLSSLTADHVGISDLSGLEYCTSLTYLDLYSNQIGNMSPLSGLTELTRLNLNSNQMISNISPLSGLNKLWELGLNSNQISDISPLSGLTSLTVLDVSSNPIGGNISPLSSLTELYYLGLRSNQISDISLLSGLTDLQWLFLESNQISDMSPLVNNPGLGTGDHVYLQSNPLSADSINLYIPQLQGRGVEVGYDIADFEIWDMPSGTDVNLAAFNKWTYPLDDTAISLADVEDTMPSELLVIWHYCDPCVGWIFFAPVLGDLNTLGDLVPGYTYYAVVSHATSWEIPQ